MALISLLGVPDGDPVQQFQARLAVIALFLGSAPDLDLGVDDDQRAAVALTVASRLAISDADLAPEPDTGVIVGDRDHQAYQIPDDHV